MEHRNFRACEKKSVGQFFCRGCSMTVMMLSCCRTDCWVDRLGNLRVGQG